MSLPHQASNLPGMLHAGQKAAPSNKAKKPGKKRKDMLLQRGRFWAEIEKKKTVENLFKKYDVSNTGYLSSAEVAKFLQDAAQGEAPTEQEVGFVMQTTHDKTGIEGKGITMSELKTALDVWKTWQGLKPEMEMYMKKYDVNQSGKLESEQVCVPLYLSRHLACISPVSPPASRVYLPCISPRFFIGLEQSGYIYVYIFTYIYVPVCIYSRMCGCACSHTHAGHRVSRRGAQGR
eukprot:Tamp_09270.p3 GENE.Tamp_09270~~Tamp_09270.p3  ORF type:complete len:234 (+),score=35.41 Tamp_09270:418-1119(+)